MYGAIQQHLAAELKSIEEAGLFKKERIITTPQDAVIKLADGSEVVNFCANNYLGLSSHPRVLEAAKRAIDTHGFGLSSVRFICGTQDIHKELEAKIAEFYGTEDTILYAAAFDANGGLFEPLLGEQDAIISDSLNHASIIDGVRLCKAMRFRYENNNMADLETQLIAAREKGARFILVVTDGVFSMDGSVAKLDKICDLAEKFDAMVMIDECHAAGFIGATGRGTPEYCNVMGRVDIITGTLGKALGGGLPLGAFIANTKMMGALTHSPVLGHITTFGGNPVCCAAGNAALQVLQQSNWIDEVAVKEQFLLDQLVHPSILNRTHKGLWMSLQFSSSVLAKKVAACCVANGIITDWFLFAEDKIRIAPPLSITMEELNEAVNKIKVSIDEAIASN